MKVNPDAGRDRTNTPAVIFVFGPFSFDPAQQELRRRTRRLPLSVSLLKLLTLFLTRRGELITRDEIAATLWQDTSTIDVVTGINTAIRRLRAQLEDDPSAPTYIETVIGLGYRFIAHVEEAEDTSRRSPLASSSPVDFPQVQQPPALAVPEPEAPAAAPITTEAPPQPPAKHRKNRLREAAVLLTLSLLLITLAVSAWWHFSRRVSPHRDAFRSTASFAPVTFNDERNPVIAEAVSPAGQLVAYSDRYGISVHPLQNGADRLLTSPASFQAMQISWHPSEDWLLASGVNLYTHKPEAWAIFLHGEAPRRLLDDAASATVSPDGRHLAYTRADGHEIWISDGIGQNAHLLIPGGDSDSFAGLLWPAKSDRVVVDRISDAGSSGPNSASRSTYESFDVLSGRLLARQENVRFQSGFVLADGRFFFPATGDFGGAKVMMVDTDPTTGRFLSPPRPASPDFVRDIGGDPAMLSASANGKWMGAILSSRTSDVYVADVQWPGPTLKEAIRLTDRSANYYPHSWTPGGDAVLFDRNSLTQLVGRQRLGQMSGDIVAQLPQTAAMAEFSPDGKWILFTEFAGSPNHAIAIFSIPAAGGTPQQLFTTGAIDEFHCPVATGSVCLLRETVAKKEFVFFALDPIQGIQREVGRLPWSPNELGDWTISPDGSTVAMANHDPENPGIHLVHLSPHGFVSPSTIPVQGFGEVREATWSPDGKGFFVETRAPGGFDLLFVDHLGHTRLLRQSPISIWGVPSPDGKKLAFPDLTVASNVWLGRTTLP